MSKSSITTSHPAPKNGLPPLHPGRILREEFMGPLGLSANVLASSLGVPPNRITAIVNGQRSVTAETAILFAAHFGNSSQFWLNLQNTYDTRVAECDKDFMVAVSKIRVYGAAK